MNSKEPDDMTKTLNTPLHLGEDSALVIIRDRDGHEWMTYPVDVPTVIGEGYSPWAWEALKGAMKATFMQIWKEYQKGGDTQ